MISKADYGLIPERVMNNLIGYVQGEEVPGGCHGSPEHVKRWMEEKRKEKEGKNA